MVSLTTPQFQVQPADFPASSSSDEEVVPITSRLCQWKAPKKKKESSMTMAEALFLKHVYGRERKRKLTPLEDFDPRPTHFIDTAPDNLPSLLKKIRGEHLCISLLFDAHYLQRDGRLVQCQLQTPPYQM